MRYVIGLVFVFVSSCSFANVFFKVEHQTQPTAYLFGTMHMICNADVRVPNSVIDAFADSEQLVVEIDLTDHEQQRFLQQNVAQHPANYLEKHLSNEQQQRLKTIIEDQLGYRYQQIKSLRPIFINALFLQHFLNCQQDPLLLDELLIQQAQVTKKTIVGLETVPMQLELFDRIPLQEQVQALYDMAVEPSQSREDLQQLQAIYLEDNSEKLFQVMRSQDDFDTFEQPFLSQRNKKWMMDLPKLIAAKSTFIAIGAGHLSGTDGLLSLLRQQGYDITPIPLEFIPQQ
jgi:uncharacterized protein YbaP (TraB family)